VQAAEARVAELAHEPIADPAPLLELARVDALADFARGVDQRPDPILLRLVRLRPREHHLLVDLPAEERLGKRRRRLHSLHRSSKLLTRAPARQHDLWLRDNSRMASGVARPRTSGSPRRRPLPAAYRRRRFVALVAVAAVALVAGILVGQAGGGRSLS